jgi:hypothetical protein
MNSINYNQLIDYHNDKRKLQDLFPFHSTLAGLNGVFVANIDNESFYINTPCIVAFDKTIIKDETYLLIDLETDEIEQYRVKFLDAFYKDGSAYFLVLDVSTDKKRVINQFLDPHTYNCPWFLIDLNYLHSTPISAKNHGNILVEEQELLEFDF